MIGLRASGRLASLYALVALVGLPLAAHAQGDGPIRLAPPRPLVTAPEQTLAAPRQLPALPGISVENLGTVAGEAVGAIGQRQGGFGTAIWSGADRAMVEQLVPRLPVRSSSRTVRDLTRRLLLTAAIPPAGEGSSNFVALRAERLFAMGDVDGAASLIGNAPAGQRDDELLTIAVQTDLLRYDLTSACSEVDQNPGIFTVFWQKATVFCGVLAGDESQAALGLALLREQGATDDTLFFELINVLTAGAQVGDIAGGDPTPLNLALLRAARAQIPPSLLSNAGPGALRTVALSPNAADDVRLRAGIAADRVGAIETAPVRELLRAHVQQGTNNDLAAIAGLVIGAAQETVPTARAAALQRGLSAAEEAGLYSVFARLAGDSLQDFPPSAEIAWIGHDAARALLLNGQAEAALGWYEVVRAEGRFDPELAAAARELWPLLRLAFAASHGSAAEAANGPQDKAGVDAVPAAAGASTFGPAAAGESVSEASIGLPGRIAVIEQLVTPAAASTGSEVFPYEEQELRAWVEQVGPNAPAAPVVLSMMAALGDPVSGAVWADVAGVAATAPETNPVDPVLWLSLQQAASERRLGDTILLALVLVGESDLSQVNVLALHGAVSALHAVGLTDEARRLAVEAALAAGA